MVSLFVAAHFAHHLLTALPVPLLPLIRDEFALDYTKSALVVSAFSLSYGISQLPAGWLGDRIGPRRLITISIGGVALAGLLVGLSQTYIMMVVFLALMGVAGGGYHPSAAPLISASVEPKNRGRALGFHVIGGSSSFFLSPLVAAAIATAWGWRGAFITLTIPTGVFAIIFYLFLSRRVEMSKTRQVKSAVQGETSSSREYLRRLVPFLVLTASSQALTASSVAFIPLFMVDHFGVDQKVAAAFISIIYSAGIWASPLGGYLSDRLGRIPIILASSFIAGPAIFSLNLIPYGIGFGALLLVIGMLNFVRMPVSEAYIFGQTPERHRSTIYGIYYLASMESAAIFTPVIGALIDRFGFYSTFTITGASLIIVTLLCSIFLIGKPEKLATQQ